MWFQDNDDIGIAFHEYFNPIPFEVIALVVAAVRIDASLPQPGS